MGRTKLIVREVFQGGRSLEEIIAPLILAHPPLTGGPVSVIIESTERPQDSLCSGKGADDVQLDNMGAAMYTVTVAIPSIIGNRIDASGNMPFNYYSQPWEYGADIYGGVTGRAYDGWACWVYPIYALTTSTLKSMFPNWP